MEFTDPLLIRLAEQLESSDPGIRRVGPRKRESPANGAFDLL